MSDATLIAKLRAELEVVTTQRDIYKSALDRVADYHRHRLRPTLEQVDHVRNQTTKWSLARNDEKLTELDRLAARAKYGFWMKRSWDVVGRYNASDAELDKMLFKACNSLMAALNRHAQGDAHHFAVILSEVP